MGRNTKICNIYPKLYLEGFYENETKLVQKEKISLVRSAWAGSQKYGALSWSGDIDTSFRSFDNMLARIKLEQKNIPLTEKKPCLAA